MNIDTGCLPKNFKSWGLDQGFNDTIINKAINRGDKYDDVKSKIAALIDLPVEHLWPEIEWQ
ncbi:hypothetical protein L0664_18380 [Octadecabacter sp. G9-8]|uniref:Ner winged helix-turn-helix DNA-binding domain-containing protein n=1 Tax=Octadecabacter dasysiphoniae TaxID=2909341 RepID=A0ABS9D0I6_9RHOB|nr:hypothetical protein [Octadecabacter dasysiphoniae]MCF2873036.1 hypothetical protein [Octadecabacter dasysiphoniae]